MAPGRASKRRRLSPEGDSNPTSKKAPMDAFYRNAAEWDLEQEYERRPRKANKKEQEKTRLPIKTAEGDIAHVEEPEDAQDESDSFLGTDDDEDEDDAAEEVEVEEEPVPKVPLKVQIIEAKEELARLATLINEDPEEHAGSFKKLLDMVTNARHPAVQKLALATQAAVYRDVIPGYRIRPLKDDGPGEKVSKEIRKLRNYEQSLLAGYQGYVKQLETFARLRKNGEHSDAAGLKSVAINCACSLLIALPHFNFRGELLKILVYQVSRRVADADFVKCRETIEEIFSKDNDGIVSLETVGLLAKMMKAKDFRVHESVLDTFLHLRLLSEFSSKGSRDRVDKESDENTVQGKKQKQKREFRTKKQRKLEKENKAVAKDLKEADALVSHEERDKNQAETLKLVFATYFRILKQRSPKLMGAVLEGLAKYAHLINQDFFGDLLEALKDLVSQAELQNVEDEEENAEEEEDEESTATRNSTREALLCVITAFALLEGQDASKVAATLHLDLSFFITHLYRALLPLSINPDIEFNPNKSLRLPDPGSREEAEALQNRSRNRVNFQTPTVLLLRCLHSTLVPRNHSRPPPIRLAGFTKRLLTSTLQLPEKSSLATLALLNRVAKQHGQRIAPLWNTEERRGDGVFNPICPDIERSNVFAGTIWEGELLRMHYCPEVREAALDVEKLIASVK